jgi:Holliday junction resolvase RusA-like endonuclease
VTTTPADSIAAASLEFVLPYPPSVNRYYRHVGCRTLISRAGRCYRETVVALLAGRIGRPLSGPLEIDVQLFPPDRRRRDCDNAQKALWDALQYAGAYVDDSQIVRAVIEKRRVMAGGRAVVRITQFPQVQE